MCEKLVNFGRTAERSTQSAAARVDTAGGYWVGVGGHGHVI